MVAISIESQNLSARNGPSDGENGYWGTYQIATPAIVGGVLILLFAIYVIWQRRPHNGRSYDYHQVRFDWVTKMEHMFISARKRRRVLHSSAPVTLDDSMRSSCHPFDFSRRSRQCRSGSSDSQTPLTSTGYFFDYPPVKPIESPPPLAKPPTVRWWWLFGSRPQQIKSQEPSQQWHVDTPDGSSTGHGNSNHGHQYAATLAPLHEDPEVGEDDVIRIGEDFTSVVSTPMTQHLPEQARTIRGMPSVPEHRSRTPASAVSTVQSSPGTCIPSAYHGSPPSYDVSQNYTPYPSSEDIVRASPSMPYMALIPPPVRAAGYPSPRVFHGRDLSSDSFLATQPPMVAASMY